MPEYTWPGRPPAGSILDTTSPYFANLVATYLFNDATSGDANGTTAKNLVNNSLAALTKTSYDSLTWSASGLIFSGNAHSGVDLTPIGVGGNGFPCTVVVLHKPLVPGAMFPERLITVGSGTGGGGAHGQLSLESSTLIGIASYGSSPFTATVADMTGGTLVTACNSSSSGNTLYQNGVNVGTTAGNVYTPDGYFNLGSGGSGGGGYTGTIQAVYVYVGRQLTDAEHAHLASAPYAPIIPAAGAAAAATAFALTGPASGTVSVASTNFTVTPNAALGQAETVAPSDGGGGGAFAPASLSFANGATAAQTFTYTPASPGAKTITATPTPALGAAPTTAYSSTAQGAPAATGYASIKVTNPRGCLPGEAQVAYLDISTAAGATDADVLPTVAFSLLNQVATAAAAPTVVRVSTGLYKVTVPTPATATWCDDICVLGTLLVGGVRFNWIVEFSIPSVATDAVGAVILQASEHIIELPADIAAALLAYSLGEYTDPVNPATSGIRLTTTGLANTPPSGGLSTGQVTELNAVLDAVNRPTSLPTAQMTASATLIAMKADSLLAKTFNHASGKYTYNSVTHVMTLVGDDGTVLGTETLTIDPSSGIVTGKQ